MVITRQVWMAAAVAGSAGCLALAPVCLALGKADAPVEITFKTILGLKISNCSCAIQNKIKKKSYC